MCIYYTKKKKKWDLQNSVEHVQNRYIPRYRSKTQDRVEKM